jgi:Secretion system C-terminal sorting domain
MKALLFSYLLFFHIVLQAQNTSFTKVFSNENTTLIPSVIELPNKDLVLILNDYITNSSIKYKSKIFTIAANGTIKDSVIFSNPNRALQIQQLIPTNYGYCLLGEMDENNQVYFWNAKLDKQFNIISQHFEILRTDADYISITGYSITKDSDVIIMSHIRFAGFFGENLVGKINYLGTLNRFETLRNVQTFQTNIISRTDSLGYLLLGSEVIATDTSFNVQHKKNLAIVNDNVATLDIEPTFIKKNDSTFYCGGRLTNYLGRRTRDLVFLTVGLKGETKFLKTIGAIKDTNYLNAYLKTIDTTRDGRYIYWGGTYNFDFTKRYFSLFHSTFVLTKMNANYENVWQKQYGSEAYYFMHGVLATSDGGCAMYGVRYDYNGLPKTDAIIIKVDGNGVVTSTTTIPMNQSSIIAYPNPSNGLLNFKKGDPSVSGAFEVNIFDISGKLVFQKRETDLSETFDFSHFAEGNYIYQIKQQEQIISVGKWVKIK